ELISPGGSLSPLKASTGSAGIPAGRGRTKSPPASKRTHLTWLFALPVKGKHWERRHPCRPWKNQIRPQHPNELISPGCSRCPLKASTGSAGIPAGRGRTKSPPASKRTHLAWLFALPVKGKHWE